MLELHYPLPATENDYMRSLVDATEANDCSYTHLFALHQFTLEQKRLQVGGALLPDLVEFYKWIHTQLSHLVTYQRAKQITIGNVISLTAKRYSQQLCDHLTKLFKRVTSKTNICLFNSHCFSMRIANALCYIYCPQVIIIDLLRI